jgi:DNA-binding transcriptional regulator YhcF (GntR family)
MDYVKISRKILEWEWYTDVNTKVLFLHILLKASWKPGRFQGIEVPRGSFVTSLQNLAAETGLTIRNVRTALKHLENTGEVTSNRHAKFSVITIKNYDKYQSSDNQVTANRQSSDNQVTTIEEGKKERKEEYNKSPKGDYESRTPDNVFITIRELYNSVCGSYPRLVKMSDARKKAINARFKTGYTLDDFQTLFEKAEASDFLKGANKRNWSATFDWLISDTNMAKVLDGNYDTRKEAVNDEPEPTNSVRLW